MSKSGWCHPFKGIRQQERRNRDAREILTFWNLGNKGTIPERRKEKG
jgi:hypothetical protein